jgi:hypothetical protein
MRFNDNYGKATGADLERSQAYWSKVRALMNAQKAGDTKLATKLRAELNGKA